MANLRIQCYRPDFVAGCCVAKVYAMLFNRSSQALKDNGSGVLTLQSYLKINHADYAITLNEHSERTKYYYLDLDESQFILPANEFGEEYYLEFWHRELSGAFDRSADFLDETRPLYWSGSQIVQAQLDPSQEDRLANWQAHSSLSFDSENNIAYIECFLDRNGAIYENPVQCEILWQDENGATINHTITSTFLPNSNTTYAISIPSIDLTPDRVGMITVTITDGDGNTHRTGSTSIHWD